MDNTTIEINPTEYKALKKAYDKVVKENLTEFTYKHKPVLVKYVYYLLEHMRNVLKIK